MRTRAAIRGSPRAFTALWSISTTPTCRWVRWRGQPAVGSPAAMVRRAKAHTVRIGTWNTWWASPRGARGDRVRTVLADPDCDILCVTEGSAGLLPTRGHIIDAGTEWGYSPRDTNRRKVLLWSRSPWSEEDCVGSPDFPGGRFVKGVAETAIGKMTVVGVCIPWDGAHVGSGRKDRRRWQDHLAWLETFERLPWRRTTPRMVVLGDFNQRIPRTWAPERAFEALLRAFDGLAIATAGVPEARIDHIAHTPDLTHASPIGTWPKRDAEAHALSDHVGVWADFGLAPTT